MKRLLPPGLLIDSARIAVGFWIWNFRKTRYRLSGGRRRCPCQSISDSGLPGESRCEASMLLDRPTRFRVVCPALQMTPHGLRCAHARADVRPYWGRVIGLASVLLLAAYVSIASGAWLLIRQTGATGISWLDAAWPPRWPQVQKARAEHFHRIAAEALQRGDLHGAVQSLSSAWAVAPDRWQDGLLLARLYEHSRQYALAESIFERLLREHPTHRNEIALQHHDTLLVSGRLHSLYHLAWREVLRDGELQPQWVVPLMVCRPDLLRNEAVHRPIVPDFAAPTFAALPETVRALLELPVARQPDGAPPDPLASNAPSDTALLARVRWETLLRLGYRAAAHEVATRNRALLGPFEGALAEWATLPPETPANVANLLWVSALPTTLTANHVERLCAVSLLAQRPAPWDRFRARFTVTDRAPLAALWITAELQQQPEIAREFMAAIQLADGLIELNLDPDQLARELPMVAALLPIPREVLYVLAPRAAKDAAE